MATEEGIAATNELIRMIDIVPSFTRHWDATNTSSVDLAAFLEYPRAGVHTVATVSLGDHPTKSDRTDLRVELVAMYPFRVAAFANVVATCAFNAINSGAPLRPGVIHEGALKSYNLSTTMEHAFFVTSHLWAKPENGNGLTRKATWLMLVPISEGERAYAEAKGTDALKTLIDEAQINMVDLNRPSLKD